MKEILRNSGFDNGLSIGLLDEKAIKDIESYIQENGESIINTLQCCSSDLYKNLIAKKAFAFTPGHKYTILAIAGKAREMRQIENENSRKNLKEHVIVPAIVESSSTSVDLSENEQLSNENSIQVGGNITVTMNVNTERLKLLLINKLKEAMGKTPNVSKAELRIDESIVTELEIQMICNKANGSGKCICSCCGSFIQATCVNGKWRAQNIIRHFRNHFGQKNAAPSNVAKITHDVTRSPSHIENSANVHSAVGEVEETTNQNGTTDKTTDFDVLKEFDSFFK